MPNHVHLVMVPGEEDGLRVTLGEAHRRYTRHINFREGWRGHLWQERFHSFTMDEKGSKPKGRVLNHEFKHLKAAIPSC